MQEMPVLDSNRLIEPGNVDAGIEKLHFRVWTNAAAN